VSRRSRGLALLGAAAACAGVAASSVSRYTNDVRAQVGPLVSAVVARTDLGAGTVLTAGASRRALEERRVPARYVPARTLASVSDAVGYRVAIPLHRGDYVGDATLQTGGPSTRSADSVGRVVEIGVAGAGSLAGALQPGARVDVLITTDQGRGPGRTYLALQDAELVGFTPSAQTVGADQDGSATASLRVSLRQAVLLTAAQSFARELRLVPRRDGDRRRLGAVTVSAADLGG
jgi:pilus assembly protein CpaB